LTRSVVSSMSVSLDGSIAGPDGGFDWTAGDQAVCSHYRVARTIGGQPCCGSW
jgi:hypothetical protein